MRDVGLKRLHENQPEDILDDFMLAPGERQALAFCTLGETYAIELTSIREIIHSTKVTPLRGAPSFISGILSVRGEIIPVIDLEVKFGGPPGEYDQRSAIVAVEVDSRTIGVRSKAVRGIITFHEDELRAAPVISTRIRTEFISGVVNGNEGLVIMLNVDRLLSDEEMASVESAGESSP